METILAFVLTVTMDGKVYDMGPGLAVFRDIYRCEQFATAIEKTANSTYVGNRVFYENKENLTQAKCLPQFVPQRTKFWD
tara:strand:- start:12 stop:251 length:240 start_codon:yes stop_codon:yes gene_type:complete